MTLQTKTNSADLHEFILALLIAETIQANPRDYGFDINENDLGRELLAPLPASLTVQSLPQLQADALEKTLYYFLS